MMNIVVIFFISLHLALASQASINSLLRDSLDQPFCTPHCPEGFYSESGYDLDGQGGGCTKCPVGYLSSIDYKECFACWAGYYVVQSDGILICRTCDYGTYSNPGSTSCDILTKKCLPGSYSVSGYDTDGLGTGCNLCKQGTFAPNPGSQSCIPCEVGYNSIQGSSSCTIPTKKCPKGTYSFYNKTGYDQDGNGTGCQQCQKCSYSDKEGATECTACPIGKTSPEGATSCPYEDKKCEPGTYSQTGYERFSICLDCYQGTYAPDVGSTTCQNCKPGSWSTKKAVDCPIKTQQCPQGMFSIQRNGYDINGEGKGCVMCSPGTYAENKGTSYCTNCPENKWSEEGASSCEINVNLCPPGKYSSTGNDYQGCFDCKEGTYSDTAGSLKCLNCPAGTYQNSQGAVQCIPCKQWTSSTEGSSFCNITQKLCIAGTYSESGYDLDGHCEGCSFCPQDTYQDKIGQKTCIQCGGGRTSPIRSTQITDCVCPPNFTGPNDGVSLCIKQEESFSIILKNSFVFIMLIFIF